MMDRRLGLTWESRLEIRDRKSSWMALYLGARRRRDALIGYYRQRHFATRRAEEAAR